MKWYLCALTVALCAVTAQASQPFNVVQPQSIQKTALLRGRVLFDDARMAQAKNAFEGVPLIISDVNPVPAEQPPPAQEKAQPVPEGTQDPEAIDAPPKPHVPGKTSNHACCDGSSCGVDSCSTAGCSNCIGRRIQDLGDYWNTAVGCSKLGDGCCGTASGCDGSPWSFGGWLAGGGTVNADGNTRPNGNLPLGFNNYADGPVLNQAWLYAERAADNGGQGFGWGFRMDFMFGADGPDTQAFGDGGWDQSWDTGGEYGFAMPQLYGEVAWNRFKTRIGHFYTIIGYEVVQAPDNFFYSHVYTMFYNEPFTHTGLLTQYDWNDNLTVYGGWTAGWDSGWGNRNNGSTFLGGVSYGLTDTTRLIYATTFGDPGDIAGATSDVYMHSIVLDSQITDRLNYVLQSDYQTRSTAGAPYADSYGVNQYLFYSLNDCWQVGGRMEWFSDEDGARVANGPGDYYSVTGGVNYSPSDRFTVRNEVRWDWFDGAGLPFDNNTSRGFFTAGSSMVYAF